MLLSLAAGAAAAGKYVPPAKRAALMGEAASGVPDAKVVRAVRGLLNKLSAGNLESVAQEFEALYGSNPRNGAPACDALFLLSSFFFFFLCVLFFLYFVTG